MNNAKLVVNLLLLATIFCTAFIQALPRPAIQETAFNAFLTKQGTIQPLLTDAEIELPAEEMVRPYGSVYTVRATNYNALEAQTDDEPFVTADNTQIKPDYSSKLHWLAVSRDLLVRWGGRIKYGDQVRVRGVSPELDGLYTVHDTMNKRHHHRIDILSNPNEKVDVFAKGVKIQRVKPLSQEQILARKAAIRQALASSRMNWSATSTDLAMQSFIQPSAGLNYLSASL